ncbi:hypothetical protein F5B18DRAFT_671266 [Nemania serpens]|nr:hypothetical protein F5B18DRAFT_671266 [Nemania serpens]
MAEYFMLLAPRARLTLPWAGELERIIFEDLDYLVRLLVVPVRPQHGSSRNSSVSSTDTIGGEKREAQRGRDDSDVHANSSRPHKQIKVHGRNDKVVSNTVITLSSLPPELHLLIFSFIPDIYDVISFGITNQYFSSIGREYLDHYIISQFGQWAGTNIVRVGQYVEPNDYPPGLFTTEELEVLRQNENENWDPYEHEPDEDAYPDTPFTLCHLTYPGMSWRTKSPKSLFHILYDLRIGCSTRGMLGDPWYHYIMPKYNGKDETYFPRNQQWILRNLTTKEIVHSNAIALSPDYIEGPNIRFLGFGHVVVSRICWSSSPPSPNSGGIPDITRGVWAGHCFDITTLSKHEAETHGEWRDVSDEVAKEIASIWECVCGSDWREIIIANGMKQYRR